MPRTGLNTALPRKTYLRGGLQSEIGGIPTAGKLLSSGKTVGNSVLDPQTQRLIPPAEQTQSRNTRGPYLDRNEYWLDVFDQYEGWTRLRLKDFVTDTASAASPSQYTTEDFVVTVEDTTDFDLTSIPKQNSEIVSLNGIVLRAGSDCDYTVVSNVVKFNPLWNLQVNDIVAVRYTVKE